MEKSKLKEVLFEVRKGNEIERERLIRHYKPYIINAVGHLCKRYITWSSDESSIGLIAFNRALETFECKKGRTFLNYVYLLIQRDLIDYFRKENREHHLSIHFIPDHEENQYNNIETEASVELYQQLTDSSDLTEEILELDEMLCKFNISFEKLEKHCPKHQDTRMMLLEMASEFIKCRELVDELLERNLFPMSAFTKKTGYRPKTIERHRKYLITLIMIKLHPEWVHLSTFVQVGPGSVKS
jgi:RNA polymerase sigma factor